MTYQKAVLEYDDVTDRGVIKIEHTFPEANTSGPIDPVEQEYVLQFQHGVIPDKGRNGLFNEDVIQLLMLRLRTQNQGEMKCRENSLAITALEEALMWLMRRSAIREEQGVLGTNQPHESA